MQPSHERASTDIDRLVAGGGSDVAATIPGSPSEPVAAPASRVPGPKQISNNRFAFFVGVLPLLIGGALLIDQVGPGTQRSAIVTGMHVEHTHGKGETTSYYVEGRDDHGGVFSVSVSSEEYDRVSTGDHVSIRRSSLTGRVVRMSGQGWELGRQTLRIVIFAVLTAVGVLMTGWSLLYSFRRVLPNADAGGRRRHLGILAVTTGIVLGGVGVWVAIERGDAHLAGAAEPLPTATPAVTATARSTGCAEVRHEADVWTAGYAADGVISQHELDIVEMSVQAFTPDCGAATVAATVCGLLRHPTLPNLPVTFDPPTLCAGA